MTTLEQQQDNYNQAVGGSMWNYGIGAGEWLGEQWDYYTGQVGDTVRAVRDTVTNIANTPADIARQGAADVGDSVEDMAEGIKDAIGSLGKGAGDAISNIGDGLKYMPLLVGAGLLGFGYLYYKK